jgi:endonuclease III
MNKSIKNTENIDSIMETLTEHYNYTERTTLNRMRKEEKPNPYKILISCLLSLRTKDENTEKVSKQLFEVASTPEEIAFMPTKKLEKLIFSSGHYHKKAQVLKHVSQVLLEHYNGIVPSNKEELLSIKGIGPKTANIVLNFAFGQLVIPVDVNVHRIVNRLGWVQTKEAEKTELVLNEILPKKYWKEFNGIFVLFGKTICVPISPKCSVCPISSPCPRIGVEKSR